ncbi:MAG: alpha/beta hydrolase [Leptospiraceae bacterium]|nr:alpha/beta hydrolase [Leptospiraceae bacterium]MCP5511353.1 alpha/beta hydrolase [Leptospiraceae bacterium]
MEENQSNTIHLILIHGFPLNQKMWSLQSPLQEKVNLIFPDLPGSGQKSEKSLFTLEFMAEEVMDEIKALKGRKILGGLSMGGYVALRILAKHQEFFDGLVLMNTRASADTNPVKANRHLAIRSLLENGMDTFLENFFRNALSSTTLRTSPEKLDFLKKIALEQNQEGLISQILAMQGRPDSSDLLSQISIPSLIVGGEFDPITPPAEMHSLAGMVQGSRLEILPGAGHYSPFENPDGFHQILLSFLKDNFS